MQLFSQILSYSLLPFGVLYDGVTSIRNFLYDKQYFASQKTTMFSICVGNLRVGGTGKTPHIEYLVRLLADTYQVATLSRGYGRKTKGFLVADSTSNAEKIGDEPMQFFLKFGNKIKVFVGEKRVAAANKIQALFPNIEILLLDDALQHRAIVANFTIILTDYQQLFYQDFLMPMGRLRENRKGINRADAIIISKCPNEIPNSTKAEILDNIATYTQNKIPVFWSSIVYLPLVPLLDSTEPPKSQNVILLTGLANSESLQKHIAKNYNLLKNIALADHQAYSLTDIEFLLEENKKYATQNPIFITTEKDMVKLQNPLFYELLQQISMYYLPICVKISDDFDKYLLKIVAK
jgi:tetraacyldisaccharide 4'-kinase